MANLSMVTTIVALVVAGLVLLLVTGNLLTTMFQAGFIFKPTRLKDTHEYIFQEDFEEMTLPGAEGGRLNALLFRSQKPASKGLVICFPPNHGNIERWGENNTIFTEGGFDFLVFDHFGFGKSKGKMTEENFYENARLVYREMSKRYKPESIILYGIGLGAAVAGKLATEVPVKRMILEAPIASIRDLFYSYYNWIPRLLVFRYKFPLHQYVQEISCPILILHGTKDTLVPYSNTAKMEPSLKHSDDVITIHGGRNNNLHTFSEFHDAMEKILYKE